MDPYEELKKNLDNVSAVKRCPKCKKLSLSFDMENSRIYCTSCGFEERLPG